MEAPGAVRIWVVGTVFSVESILGSAGVTVFEGTMRVELSGHDPAFVGAGQRLEVNIQRRTTKLLALSAKAREAFQGLGVPSEEAAVPAHPASRGMGSAPAHERAPAGGLAAGPPGGVWSVRSRRTCSRLRGAQQESPPQ